MWESCQWLDFVSGVYQLLHWQSFTTTKGSRDQIWLNACEKVDSDVSLSVVFSWHSTDSLLPLLKVKGSNLAEYTWESCQWLDFVSGVYQLLHWQSFTTTKGSRDQIWLNACEKVDSDLSLSVVFPRYSTDSLLPLLKVKGSNLAEYMWESCQWSEFVNGVSLELHWQSLTTSKGQEFKSGWIHMRKLPVTWICQWCFSGTPLTVFYHY